MRLHRIDIGAVEQPLIRVGIVGFDQFDKFELPHHRAAAPILLRPNPVMPQPVIALSPGYQQPPVAGSATPPEASSHNQGSSSGSASGSASSSISAASSSTSSRSSSSSSSTASSSISFSLMTGRGV